MTPIQVHNDEHAGLHYQDLAANSYAAWHEPFGGEAIWSGQFEQGPDELPEGWEVTGDVVRVTGGSSGNWCARGGDAGGGLLTNLKYLPVDVGRKYTLDWSRKADAVSATHSFELTILCYDAAKAALASVTLFSEIGGVPNVWTRESMTVGTGGDEAFTANTAYIRIRFSLNVVNAPVAGEYVYVDDVVLEPPGAGGGGAGETNTASNVGTAGIGVYDAKVGVDLQFRKIHSLNSALVVALDAPNQEVTLTVAPLNFTINAVIDGGGLAITPGIKGDLMVDFACTLLSATLLADQVGSIVIDIWKGNYAGFPPVDAGSITAAAPPTLAGALKSQDVALVGWTVNIAAGDILRFNVDSAATCLVATLALKGVRT